MCLFSLASVAQEAAELKETARTFVMQGDYDNAVIVLTKASQLEPDNIEITKDLLFANYLKRDFAKALEIGKPLLTREDSDAPTFQMMGMVYRAIAEDVEAEKLYKAGIKKFPYEGVLYSEYGDMISSRKPEEALKIWETGIQQAPNHSTNYYFVSKQYATKGDALWSIIYGEMFLNMESFTAKSIEMKNIVLAEYKSFYANGVANAFEIPGFVPEYVRPLFCDGKGPFRWAALSGDPEDIYRTDRAVLETFPENSMLCRWIEKAQKQIHFQGLPARICWLGYGERAKMGKIFNDLVRKGELKAPIVIGRDHLDCGSVASPNRETEKMKDGSDAIADWPILNALLNASGGASWVSVHHGGGVGMGLSIHAGMVVVADGTKEAEIRLQRVLTYDPGMGIMRHADAGYERAIDNAKREGVNIPMMK